MALPLDYFAIDFQSNRDIPRCRRLLAYYWQRSLCQAVKTAVHEVARAGVGGVMWQLLTPRACGETGRVFLDGFPSGPGARSAGAASATRACIMTLSVSAAV